MTFFDLLTITALGVYGAASVAASWALRRRSAPESPARPFVSVVVAARDEEERLPGLLADLAEQTYAEFEAVIVDDRSTDGTAELVREAAARHPGRFRLLRQAEVPAGLSPKKLALQRGVEASKGELLLLTDADCRVPRTWVEGMAGAFRPDVAMVLGCSEFAAGSSLFERYQAFDFLTLTTTMVATARLGLPLGASGHNLSYRRTAFDRVGGYSSGLHRVAGDDMLMLYLLRPIGRIACADGADTRVRTDPVPTLRAFRNQRARWASSGMHHFATDPRVLAYGAASLYANVFVMCGPLFVWTEYLTWSAWIAGTLAKLAADLLLYGSAARRRNLLRYLPLWFLAQPIYLTAMAFWGTRARFTWK
ncbi:MAG TPA: glycosyltransferase [Longimicrobium sp.]|jgi:cellulose synthase/poly-beta-1,6-N-acetylglucosamine synthase-like glycosyltransferase